MKNEIFILRHKNMDVAILQIDNEGDIHDARILQPAHVPFVEKKESVIN